jgi:hypothetical protein
MVMATGKAEIYIIMIYRAWTPTAMEPIGTTANPLERTASD